MTLQTTLTLGTLLFSLGLYTTVARKNLVAVLMGIELMLNGAGVNFAAYAYFQNDLAGYMMTTFIMVVAVMEAVVALALFQRLFRQKRTLSSAEIESLRE